MKTLLLTKDEVGKLLDIKDAIDAVEEGYKAFNSGEVVQPAYIALPFEAPRGEIDFKVGYNKNNETVSMKASSGGFANNQADFGLPPGMNTVLVWDGRSCALKCIMDGTYITGYRTGAAGAISVKYLARKNAEIVASIGTGNQARNQIKAIREVMDIKEIHAYDEFEQSMVGFKEDIERDYNIPVILEKTKKEAVEKADVLITTTRGKGSVVDASWIKKGTHIVAVGTDIKGKQEYDPEIFRKATVVNDSIDQCAEKGETQHGINGGIITREQIHGEIGEIILGTKCGRTDDDEITLFDTTGMVIQDNVTAYKIYQRAVENNVGTYFEFF